jgi:DNA-binding MarR family transcriptional regulator
MPVRRLDILDAMASTLLTHQARVLLAVAEDCNVRMRDLANRVGLTERAVYDALSQLIEGGYIERERVGRRNCYRLALEPKDGGAAEIEAVGELAQLLHSKVGS